MFELTQDVSTITVWRQHNLIIYYRWEDDVSWLVAGKYNESNPNCRGRQELDCPTTPELKDNCGLRGIWI